MNDKKMTGFPFPFPLLMVFIMGFSGIGLFCFYVVWQVVKSIPPDFSMPWYINIIPIVFLIIAIVMLLWVKKYNKDIVEEV